VFGELLDATVEAIDNVEVILTIESQTRGAAQLTLAAARFAPLAQKFPVFVKDRNSLQVFVSDIQVLVPVQVNGRGPDKLPILGAKTNKLIKELMVRSTFADALAEFFPAAVDDVQDAVSTQGKIHRIPKPQARHAIHANAITVVK